MMLDGAVQGALMIALGGLGSLLLWVLVGRKIITKHGADAWIARLTDPDDEMGAAIDALVSRIADKLMTLAWNWFLTAQIPTGKEAEGEDGQKHPIMTTPCQSLIDAFSRAILLKVKSMRGGLTTQGNAALADELGVAPSALLGPRKGQSTAEWVVEQALVKALQPGGFLERKVKGLVGESSAGGAEKW